MPRRLWAILAVAFGVGLSVLDSAIANVALPTIGQELGISSADSIWIVNAYQLAIMVSLLSFSALGELVGYRKVYIGGLMLFTVASVGCALSSSLATLVLARVMQGFGAAAVTSVNTTLIRIIYPKAQLGRGLGLNATVVAVSSVAGPTIAAGILSIAHWPWLFAVNIPVGLVALSLSRRFLPDNPVRVGTHRFDWRDAVMNALTFGLLMASVEGFSHGLDPRILSAGISALLVVTGLVALILLPFGKNLFNLSIDFAGGTEMEFNMHTEVTQDVQTEVSGLFKDATGVDASSVTSSGDGNEDVLIRSTSITSEQRAEPERQ